MTGWTYTTTPLKNTSRNFNLWLLSQYSNVMLFRIRDILKLIFIAELKLLWEFAHDRILFIRIRVKHKTKRNRLIENRFLKKIFRGKWLKCRFLFYAYESRRSSQGMRFATSGLSVTKHGAAEAFHCHFDEVLNTGILQDVLLRGTWLENDIVRKYLRFFIATARNRIALRDKRYNISFNSTNIGDIYRCGKICVRKDRVSAFEIKEFRSREEMILWTIKFSYLHISVHRRETARPFHRRI